MSARRWVCCSCGWEGTTQDASYTDAGAKRCPTCKSGALVLADPEGEERNAAGAAKRINLERTKKLQREVPLLLHAGIETPTLTTAAEVMERREYHERHGAISERQRQTRIEQQEAQGLEVRARLVPLLHPELLAALDARRQGLPRDYGLSFWSDVERRHASGELAAEQERERLAGEHARQVRAELQALVSVEEMAALDADAERFRCVAGDRARIYWRARLADHLKVAAGPKLDEERERQRRRSIECATCKAAPGAPCRQVFSGAADGSKIELVYEHEPRRRVAGLS